MNPLSQFQTELLWFFLSAGVILYGLILFGKRKRKFEKPTERAAQFMDGLKRFR